MKVLNIRSPYKSVENKPHLIRKLCDELVVQKMKSSNYLFTQKGYKSAVRF